MKPPPFDYLVPESLTAALEAVKTRGEEAKVLAGGQSLVPAMNFRVAQPALLVDLNGLAELDYVEQSDDGALRIGAMTRQGRLERDSTIAQALPLLHEALPQIAHPQIRNRGTLGGSLAHADPAAELPVVAVALEARLRAQSLERERWIDAADFFLGMFTTALRSDEILIEVEFPALPARTGTAFMEVARRKGDYALGGVAAVVTLADDGRCERVRLVYLNAGDGPVSAPQAAARLQGQSLTPDRIRAAAAAAAEDEIDPLGNVHATIPYQRHLARVLTERSLVRAHERAQSAA